jgi:hypothetical protein
MKSWVMKADEYWIEKIQDLLNQPHDDYIKALHIYAEVVLKAMEEVQGEYEMLIFTSNTPPN